VIPLSRNVSPDEYAAISRRVAADIGIDMCDDTTYEPHRLMYWPSCCADSQYIYLWQDRPLISANGLLAKYEDWRDCALWPQVPGAVSLPKLAVKQGDPEGKKGVVGAFCRTYDVFRAMDELIPGMYEPVDNMPGRYTYLGGSTTGGAVVYDNGKFLYSHHATDPCSNRLVNAFDLVRLHRFGDKDDEAQPGTPTNRLPSYVAMCELAVQDAGVAALMSQERYQEAVQDFEGVAGDNDEDPANWMTLLALNTQTGLPKATIDNVWIILEHDPLLKGRFALNRFAGRGEVLGALPWDARTVRRLWDDNDNEGLYWYMERYHHITGNGKIDGALSLHATAHAFNEVQDFLSGLAWDGVPRLDTLFIDYLGAADTPYTRAVTRKAFTAAVTRAMIPGSKYDNMLILAGPQGLGKSTLLDKMSRGWFNDSIRTFEGKEASELLQGVWLVEISELDAFRRTDVARIKQFLSLRTDRFRAAYGRHVKELPRCCVFFGTTNTKDFLQDRTGNRRFWPVDVGVAPVTKGVWTDLPGEIDQLWAEAKVRWQLGEPLYLSGELEEAAKVKQEEHREVSAREGIIMDFLSRQVPEDWQSWPLDRRRMFWAGSVQGDIKLVDRDRVCALEVWCEALDGRQKDMRYSDTAEINSILEAAAGWEKSTKAMRCGYCGVQRGFRKTV
jgi:predicted P-loop ATPase